MPVTRQVIFEKTLTVEPLKPVDEVEEKKYLDIPPGVSLKTAKLITEAYSDAQPVEGSLYVWWNGMEAAHIFWGGFEGGNKGEKKDITGSVQKENTLRVRFEKPGVSSIMLWGRTCHVKITAEIEYESPGIGGPGAPGGSPTFTPLPVPVWAVAFAAVSIPAAVLASVLLVKRVKKK